MRISIVLTLALAACGSGDKNDTATPSATTGAATGAGTGAATGAATGTGTGTGSTTDPDVDGDGSPASIDCDDADPERFPGNTERCDAIDHDCDGVADNGVPYTTWYADGDADGYGDATATVNTCDGQPAGYVADDTDCDDLSDQANPSMGETCDEIDNNCDGTVDEGVTLTWYPDLDGDGHGDASGTTTEACTLPAGFTDLAGADDCDDAAGTVFPGATETCDGIDEDCDGAVDDGAPGLTWYLDADGDGFGGTTPIVACPQPPGGVATSTDCDDTQAAIYPGAPTDRCDLVDTDCDGTVEEWIVPADGDLQVVIDVSASGDRICLTQSHTGSITVAQDVVLEGVGNPTIGQGFGAPAVTVSNSHTVELRSLVLGNQLNDATAGAGLHLEDGSEALLVNVDVVDNTAGFQAGGIYVAQTAQLTMEGGTIARNTINSTTGGQWLTGGGLFARAGSSTVLDGVVVEDNLVLSEPGEFARGAGLAFESSYAALTDVLIRNNEIVGPATGEGGGIWANVAATVVGTRLDLRNNAVMTDTASGGGMFFRVGSGGDFTNLILAGNRVESPSGSAQGSAFMADSGAFSVSFATVYGNEAIGGSGGGTWVPGSGQATLDHVILQANSDSVGTAAWQGFTPSASWVSAYGNSAADWSNGAPAGALSVDALFADVTSFDIDAWDLDLSAASTLRDAGDPALLDTDSSPADYGAFGGPDGW